MFCCWVFKCGCGVSWVGNFWIWVGLLLGGIYVFVEGFGDCWIKFYNGGKYVWLWWDDVWKWLCEWVVSLGLEVLEVLCWDGSWSLENWYLGF